MPVRIEAHRGLTIQPGATLFAARLSRFEQEALHGEIRAALAEAPLFRPEMPRTGKPLSVRMSNLGPLGWVSDRAGYRYQATHPLSGRPWPDMPQRLLDLWAEVGGYPAAPEACLVNSYDATARMGLHQDRDEADFSAPIVSVSLGDTCRFRLGGTSRTDPTRSFELASGDVLVLAGPSRLAFHGVDRILAGTSTLVADGGRINLTLRRVTIAG
ncbi:MAG: alpha-ketoglutarate-dependent dioxygenase AlkB [Ancalomicrobiaceae bacterium]|nr:alpha-ketoglutarate-dependent dioxygenase AlkB [Ancalomicrobiaceae bacterium]